MTKNEQLDDLFSDWEKRKWNIGRLGVFEYNMPDQPMTFFVKDGVICEEKFESEDNKGKRILYILRDSHDTTGEPNQDYREYFGKIENCYGEGNTWNNIARWTRALREDNVDFASVQNIDAGALYTQMQNIAIMNLKKSAGGSRAMMIQEHAKAQKENIKEEIRIIDPDVIVACGTFDNLLKIGLVNIQTRDGFPGASSVRNWRVGQLCIKDNPPILVVESYHPAYKVKNKGRYYDMQLFGRLFLREHSK